MNQRRPWFSLAALLALAGCCMSPPSPVDGVPYGGWGDDTSLPDRGTPPEPVSVPADAPLAPAIPTEKRPVPVDTPKTTPDTKGATVGSTKTPPAKPPVTVDPLREPLRLPLAAIDRSPTLTLEQGIVRDGTGTRAPQLGNPSASVLSTENSISPGLDTSLVKPTTTPTSAKSLPSVPDSSTNLNKNPTIHLGSPASANPLGVGGNAARLGEVQTGGTVGVGGAPSLGLTLPVGQPTAPSLAAPLSADLPTGASTHSNSTDSSLSLGLGTGAHVRDIASEKPIAIQVGATDSTASRLKDNAPTFSNAANHSDTPNNTTNSTLGIQVGAVVSPVPVTNGNSPSFVVPGAKVLPTPGVDRASSVTEPSSPRVRSTTASTTLAINSPQQPSVSVKETLNPPTAKSVTPPRSAEIKVADSLSVKTGTPVARSSTTVPSPVAIGESKGQPLTKDRSAPIAADAVIRVVAPTEEEIAQREEEKRKREEEIRSHESSLRQWLHDHLPLFF